MSSVTPEDPLTSLYRTRLSLLLAPVPYFSSSSSSALPVEVLATNDHCAHCQTRLIGGVNGSVRLLNGKKEWDCATCGKTGRRKVHAPVRGIGLSEGKEAFESVRSRNKRRRLSIKEVSRTPQKEKVVVPPPSSSTAPSHTSKPPLPSSTSTSVPLTLPPPPPLPSSSLLPPPSSFIFSAPSSIGPWPKPPFPAATALPSYSETSPSARAVEGEKREKDGEEERKKKRSKGGNSLAAMLEAKKLENARNLAKEKEGGGLKDFLMGI